MGATPRRSWSQRLVLSLNVFLVFALLASALALLRYNQQVSQINRIAGAGTLSEVKGPTEPVNILLVGVDNAEGLDPDDPVLTGRSETSLLSDTIMVVRVDPDANRAWLLSIPRDLWVPIAGTGSSGRINEALALGGPAMLIDTINEVLDIPINHYVQVNFAGFRNLVEVVGGVPVWFDYPARDENSGLAVPTVGCINLEGEQALAFARSRYFEVLIDDQWVADPTADQGRIARQQTFIRAAINRAINQGARNPVEMQRLINATKGEVVLDDNLSLDSLLDLGERFRTFDPDSFEVVTLPIDNGFAGAAAVGFLRTNEAQPLLAVFRGQSLFSTPNALVRVEVLNGTSVTNQAFEVAAALTDEGFSVVGTGDAPGHSGVTEIRYAPGALLEAVLLARYLGVNVPFVEAAPGEVTADTGVVLVTGSDWSGLRDEPLPAEMFQRYLDVFAAQVGAGDDTAATSPGGAGGDTSTAPASSGGLTVDAVGETGPVTVPSITTTTVTPEKFVPTPPEGVECG